MSRDLPRPDGPYRTPFSPRAPRPPARAPWLMLVVALVGVCAGAVGAVLRHGTREAQCRDQCIEEARQCLDSTREMTPAARSIRSFVCEESVRMCIRESCRFP